MSHDKWEPPLEGHTGDCSRWLSPGRGAGRLLTGHPLHLLSCKSCECNSLFKKSLISQVHHTRLAYHHLITKFIIEGVWEEPGHRGQTIDNVERQAPIVPQHHQQRAHVSVDLVYFYGSSF